MESDSGSVYFDLNLESHKAYEKHLAEQNQRKMEDEKNQKFQKSVRDTVHEGKYTQRERSRSAEKASNKLRK